MANGAGFIPVVLLAIALVVDRFAVVVSAGGAAVLGRALERCSWFLLIAGAVAFGVIWSPLR